MLLRETKVLQSVSSWKIFKLNFLSKDRLRQRQAQISLYYKVTEENPLYLGHPLPVLSFQPFLGFLEMGMFILIARRLQVLVHGIRGAGCCCRNWKGEEGKARWEEKQNAQSPQESQVFPGTEILEKRMQRMLMLLKETPETLHQGWSVFHLFSALRKGTF